MTFYVCKKTLYCSNMQAGSRCSSRCSHGSMTLHKSIVLNSSVFKSVKQGVMYWCIIKPK